MNTLPLRRNNTTKISLLVPFFILIFPFPVFGFSGVELNALESAGNARGSSSPWRTNISFSLQRNTLLNSSYVDRTGKDRRLVNPLDADAKDSLFDLSRLYYSFSLNLDYSLKERAEKFEYEFFKKTELFLNSAFSSPVTGYRSHFDPYTSLDYIHYALEDISVGLKMPVYTKANFFSDFSVSLVPYPVSKFSHESGLLTSFKGMISLLYFLKKETKWSLAVSSSHDLAYSQYAKEKRGGDEYLVNTPLSTSQQGHLIYRQKIKNICLPVSGSPQPITLGLILQVSLIRT